MIQALLGIEKWSFCPHENLCMNVHRSCVCNHQKLETAQIPSRRWMVKPRVVQSPRGILLSKVKEWTVRPCGSLDKSQRHDSKWKKAGLHFLWQSQNCSDREQITNTQEWLEGLAAVRWHREFFGVIELFYTMIVVMSTQIELYPKKKLISPYVNFKKKWKTMW